MYKTWFILAAALFTSCVKNNSYLDPPRLFVYVDPPFGSPLTYNQLSYNQLVFRDSVAASDMAFPVRLFNACDQDIQLTGRIEVSLLPAYDRLAGPATPSPPLPMGAFTLADSAVVIKAGATISPDSIKLKLTDISRMNLPSSGQTFVIPVRLNTTDPGVLPLSDTLRQTMFFQVFVTRVWSYIAPGDYGNIRYLQLVKQSDGGWMPGNEYLQGTIGFPVSINTGIGAPLTINIVPDPSLTAGFNTANSTSYMSLPPAAYEIINNGSGIPAGYLSTDNNYYIQLTPAFVPQPGAEYLLPLRIKNEGIVPPGQDSTAYIAITVDPETIYARTGWEITGSSSENAAGGNPAANVLDGDYNSIWSSFSDTGPAIPPQWFTVDMGKVNQVKGIMFRHGRFAGMASQPKLAKIYTSTDQVNWDAGQEITIAAAPSPNKNIFIDLPASVQARYIRFEVRSTQADPSDGVSVAEFGVY